MDILFSLPIVSYFFSTSLTSWSTSLNLLFFYMTWSTLVLSHSPLKIEIVGVTALRIALWLVPSLFFVTFDTLLPSLSENIKYNGASALPPRDAKSLAKLAGLALFNLASETSLEAAISLGLASLLKTPVFRTTTTLPLPWQMAKHIALLFTARELLTYSIHRYLLHGHPITTPTKTKTKRINRTTLLTNLHTSHAHRSPTPPSALNLKTDHPAPYILHHFIPLYLPALCLTLHTPLHILTYLLFIALTTLEETLCMSGYAIVPGIVVGGMVRRTALHYSTRGKGNFGTWGVLDWCLGTSVGGDVVGDLKGEVEKHRLGSGRKGRKTRAGRRDQ